MPMPNETSYFRQIGERARKLGQPAQEAVTGQLQSGIGQAQQPLGAGQIQAAAGQVAAQQGQAAVQARQQAASGMAEQAQLGMQAEERQRQGVQFDRAMELERTIRQNEQRLFNMNRGLANQLVTEQMKFQEDELGRQYLNDRQLADYALISAKSEEDWLNYEQTVTQLSKRRMQLLETAYAKIKQAMTQDWQLGEQGLDQEHKMYLARAKAEIERKIREEQAASANRAAMFSAGGMLLGVAAGAAIITTGGAAAVPIAATMPAVGQGLGMTTSVVTE